MALPLESLPWSQSLHHVSTVPKIGIVSTCACNLVSERSFWAERMAVSRCPACWTWVWRSVWEVQCDTLDSARCDVCAGPRCCSVFKSYPSGHSAMLLVLPCADQSNEFDGPSQSLGSIESAAASGFLLMTNSRLSPVSIIRGTVRQQSKSLVLIWFTCNIRIKDNTDHSTSYCIHIF